jgi:hypothetical protein
VFEVPRREAGSHRRLGDDQVENAILARLTGRTYTTTTLAFLLGLHEGLVVKHVNQMIADDRLFVEATTPGAQDPQGRRVGRSAV